MLWTGSSPAGSFNEKPVALFNASPRSSYAQASLAETLAVMTARLIPEASINAAPPTGNDGLYVCLNADLSKRIECALATFVKAIDSTHVGVVRGPSSKPAVTRLGGD